MAKIVLGLVACLCITSIVHSLQLEEIVKSDSFISALLSTRLTTDSTYKSLTQIQIAAYRMSERRLGAIDSKLQRKLVDLLKVASKAKNTEKMNELIGKLLFVTYKLEPKATLDEIVRKFKKEFETEAKPARKRRDLTSVDLFTNVVFEELLAIDGGVSLIFAVDTTGSMHDEIVESKQIATDIIKEPRFSSVDYILSLFNDPHTGPVIHRDDTETSLILDDIDKISVSGGGDCAELAFTGMQNALDFGPQYGSSMFVFTDAPPKDVSAAHIQALVDTAYFDDIKISFFLNKVPCYHSGIDTSSYYQVAADTGGTVFTFETGSTTGRRKRRALASAYSSFVKSSLLGSSLIKSKPASPSTPTSTIVSESFDIDDQISFVTVIVTASRTKTPSSVSVTDAAGVLHTGTTQENAIVFNIENPVPGKWKLTYPAAYSYTISVAFKTPITIDVRYFFLENPRTLTLTMVSRPMKDIESDMMINFVGGENVELSTVRVSVLRSDSSLITRLRFVPITTDGSFKLKVRFTPPNESYRIRVTGVTKGGYAFERLTNQLIKPAPIVFKTLRAGEENSVALGSTQNLITAIGYVTGKERVSATFNIHAKQGAVSFLIPGTATRPFRRRKNMRLLYNAPTDKALKGKTDHITIDVEYAGEVTTHRISIMLI